MQTFTPGSTSIIAETGLPSGESVGYQVLKAATGTVAVPRTTVGVVERPSGSGAYVFTFITPVEGDLYLFVADWSSGVIAPETSRVTEIKISATVDPGSSGLGRVADYVKMYMGGEIWRGLSQGSEYGESFIAQAIALVKARTFATPPDTAGEDALDPRVLSYLGICAALELIPAARDYWGSQYISQSTASDPIEIVTYANRAALVGDLQEDLRSRLAAAAAAAGPIIGDPVVQTTSLGPAIDECSDRKVTDDPRDSPTYFEDTHRTGLWFDEFGRRRSGTGVRL